MVDLIDNLPQDPEIYIAVMLFAGSTTACLTKRQHSRASTSIDQLTPTDRTLLAAAHAQLHRRRARRRTATRTDFVKPLADIYALINRDIADTRLAAQMAAQERHPRPLLASSSSPTASPPRTRTTSCCAATR